jgi:predicted nucleotidyltransferase
MDQETVIAKLREHAPELKAAGIVHLRLHGSVARGQQTPLSDVDLIAEFDANTRLSILDMVGLERRLAEMLGTHVDLSPAKTLKDAIRKRAAHEAILAF